MSKIKKAVAACAAIGIVVAASAIGIVVAAEYEGLIYITSDFYESIRIDYAYDSSTGVMYIVSGKGGISPLYNPDGSLRIYTEG